MTTTSSARPPATDARSRLIEAGLDVFGAQGYAGASTRQLARQAGVNLAAIPYHFGGKEGLYRAVIQHIADHLQQQVMPALAGVQQQLADDTLGGAQAAAAFERMLTTMINFIIGTPEARRFARIIVREQMDPSAAFDIIFDQVWRPALGLASGLLARVKGEAAPSRTTALQVYALMGQVLAFRASRENIVRYLGLEGYSTDETAEIRAVILQQTRLVLTGLAGGGA